MLLTIGYFLVVSMLVGRKSSPYRSVLPSRAFTEITIGGFHPEATSLEMSAFSSGTTTLPVLSRRTETGGTSGWEYTSTKYFPSGENDTSWSPTSGVRF